MTDAELQRVLVLDAGAGPALAIDPGSADAIIDAALDGAGFGPGGGGGARARESGAKGPGGSASGSAAAGTKIAIVAGVAVVAVVLVIALLVDRGGGGGARHVTPPLADAAVLDSVHGSGSLAAAPPDAAPAEIIIFDEAPAPSPPRRDRPRTKPAPRESAADLLGEANAKRAAKQWRESDALYTRVVERAPKSFAAQTALIASASLRLEHLGDPKGALQRFRRALAIAPSGALAEDARWGIAEAARATRDRAAEATALDDFLAHHASSPLAPRARARRAELP
jgi:hypothetical protein